MSTTCGSHSCKPNRTLTSGESTRRVLMKPGRELLNKSTGTISLLTNGSTKTVRRKPELPPNKPKELPRLENKLQHTDKVSCSTTRPNLKALKSPLMELSKRWKPTLESWRMKPEVKLHGIMPTTNTKLR